MVHQHTNKTFINPPVNTVGDLTPGFDGEIRLVVSEGSLYRYSTASSSWINTGVPGTGSFFADGTVPAKGDFNIAGFDLMNVGQLSSSSGSQLDLLSKVTDGATAIALNVDTVNALSNAGAKLLSLKVQGVEKFAIDKDGIITVGGGLTSTGNVNAFLDTDNNDSSETFTVYHNVSVPTPGFELFQVRANGEVEIYGGPLIGGASPFTFKSKEANGASAVGFGFETNNSLTTNGSKIFRIKNASNEVFNTRLGTNLRGETAQQLYEYFDDTGTRTRQEAHFFDTGFSVREVQDFVSAGRHIFWHSNDFSQGPNGETVFIDSSIDATSANLEQWVQTLDGGGGYAGYAAINMYGDATSRGTLQLQAYDDSGDSVDFNITTEDQSALSLTNVKGLFSVNGTNVLALAANGDVAIGGTLFGGSSPFKLKSRETDGASAVGFELDTNNTLSTSGSKLISIKNNTAEKFSVDKDGNVTITGDIIYTGGSTYLTVVLPSEGGAGIQSAVNAVNSAGGGIVQLLEGTYVCAPFTLTDINNVMVRGVGDGTILEHDNSSGQSTIRFIVSSAPFYAGNAVTSSDSSVFTTVAANAGNFLVGDFVTVEGVDADSLPDFEVHEVAANGNAGTGEIQLVGRIKHTMATSVFLTRSRNNRNNTIRDMKFTYTGANGLSAIEVQAGYNCLLENLFSTGNQGSGTTPFQCLAGGGTHYSFGYKNTIRECRVTNYPINGIGLNNQVEGTVEKCHIYNGGTSATRFNQGMSIGDNIRDCKFSDNIIENLVGGMGIQSAVNFRRRILITNNRVINCYHGGIAILDGNDCVISNNFIDTCGKGSGSGFYPGVLVGELSGSKNCIISNNFIKNCKIGITIAANGPNCSILNNVVDGTFVVEDAIVSDAAHCIISGNVVKNSLGSGMYIARKGTICSNNTVRDCATTGIHVSTDSASITGNTTQSNGGVGLVINNATVDTIIIGNNCNGDGITYGTGTGNDFANNKE